MPSGVTQGFSVWESKADSSIFEVLKGGDKCPFSGELGVLDLSRPVIAHVVSYEKQFAQAKLGESKGRQVRLLPFLVLAAELWQCRLTMALCPPSFLCPVVKNILLSFLLLFSLCMYASFLFLPLNSVQVAWRCHLWILLLPPPTPPCFSLTPGSVHVFLGNTWPRSLFLKAAAYFPRLGGAPSESVLWLHP